MIKVKRLNKPYEFTDGLRIFVDKEFPARYYSRKRSRIDIYLEEIAPSDKLWKWASSNFKKRWRLFLARYNTECMRSPEKKKAMLTLRKLLKSYEDVTLIFHFAIHSEYNVAEALKIIAPRLYQHQEKYEKKMREIRKAQKERSKNQEE